MLNSLKKIHTYSLTAVAALAFAALVQPAAAVEMPTLFSAEVALDEDSRNPRDDAYRAALAEVLTRVSGSSLSEDAATIDELFPVPAAYVIQFRKTSDETLWVSFDGEAIEKVLRANGQTVWGADRPLTLVWLAVDWGSGNREIVAAGDPERSPLQSRSIDRNQLLRERVLEIAERRGLPVAFPLLDTTDLQSVSFSDIWGGFDERIVAASRRYEANSILIGRIRPSSSQRNRWTYIFGDETRSMNGEPEAVIAEVSNLLAAEFAIGGDLPVETVAMRVAGIDSVDAYGALQALLANVGVIEDVRIAEVSGDTVRYEVDVRGGEERLRRALRFAGLLEQQRYTSPDSSDPFETALPTLEFFYGDAGS